MPHDCAKICAHAAKSVLRAHAARKSKLQVGLFAAVRCAAHESPLSRPILLRRWKPGTGERIFYYHQDTGEQTLGRSDALEGRRPLFCRFFDLPTVGFTKPYAAQYLSFDTGEAVF